MPGLIPAGTHIDDGEAWIATSLRDISIHDGSTFTWDDFAIRAGADRDEVWRAVAVHIKRVSDSTPLH